MRATTDFVTIEQRKRAAVLKMGDGLSLLRKRLSAYAVDHNGRFLIYGSAARGDYRFDSDVDLLVDFPGDETDDAWKFAESNCADLGLVPDVRPVSLCDGKFLEHVKLEAEVINGC